MPKDKIWTEFMLDYLPVNRDRLSQQMVVRFSFLLLIWLSGLLAYGVDGLADDYLSNSQLLSTLFGNGIIILFGTYMIQQALPEAISSFKELVDLGEDSFQKLSGMIEKLSFSFIPCLVICIVYTLLLKDMSVDVQRILVEGLALHSIWGLFFVSFNNLLISTGFWMGFSIWLTVFQISRQPLRVELSTGLIERFRGLSMLTFWFSLFYFLAVSISFAVSVVGAPAVSLTEVLFSPLVVFIVIGVACVIIPFYNIHRALIGLKKRELSEIELEYERLRIQLDEASRKVVGVEVGAFAAMSRLFSLQIRERKLREAPEWPIDIGFVSKLASVVLIPAVVRIAVELFNRLYMR